MIIKKITSYLTLTNDVFMNVVRLEYPRTLKANYTNSNKSSDSKNHNFVNAYLKGDSTGPAIIQEIKNILPKLEVLPFARTKIVSSSLKSVGYLAVSEILEAEFMGNSRIYRYYNVPQATFDSLMRAESQGACFYANIRSSFTYKQVYEGR